MNRDVLVGYLNDLLAAARFKDYCPNGLQVEGRAEIRKIVAGVTASQALVDAAIERDADALLVHHGWFWRGEDVRVTGLRKRRLQALLDRDINLIAYHLPLDAHPELGNNAQLAQRLGWCVEGRYGEQEIGWFGRLETPLPLADLATRVEAALQRPPLVIGNDVTPGRLIRRIAWCSGGGQSYFDEALTLAVDAFLSGEISEPQVHMARESGVAYIAAGHHATERGGVAALAAHLSEKFALDCEFLDLDNPV